MQFALASDAPTSNQNRKKMPSKLNFVAVAMSRPFVIGAALFVTTLLPATAAPVIDKRLVVNVIQVCDDLGLNCASTGAVGGNDYFAAEANKIWAQAGIDISFVTGTALNSTFLLNSATGVADFTQALLGPGTTMWLVNSLFCDQCTLFGEAWSGSGGLVIDMSAVLDFSAAGRIDTIAHELGHNLGLYEGPGNEGGHDNSNPNFLMASGDTRIVPSSLSEICPDPDALTCLDLLSADHIATARASSLLVDIQAVPEPSALALVGLALFAAGAVRRRGA